MTPQTVATAKATIAQAQADLQKAQLATAKEQLLAVRAEGRKVKAELDKLLREIRELDAAIALADGDRVALANAINAHRAEQPDPADFPSEAEIGRWQKELARLTAEQRAAGERLIEMRRERAHPLMRSLELDKAVISLQYQARNLEARIRGELIGNWPEGGVGPVL